MVRTHNINPTTIPPRTRMTLHPPHLLFTKIFISPTLTNQLVHAPLIYNPSFTSPPSLIHENIYLSDPYEPTCTCPSHLQPLVYIPPISYSRKYLSLRPLRTNLYMPLSFT